MIVCPTVATVPSSTFNSNTFPLTGEGISTTALSFCTSAKTSSSLISSFGFTNHLTISPSWIPSPMSGSLNSNGSVFRLLDFVESLLCMFTRSCN